MAFDDLRVDWLPVTQDIGGQPANVLGYRIYDLTNPASPELKADAGLVTSFLLVDYITDPLVQYPVAVAAYNSVGEGPLSVTVVPGSPAASVPEQVQGVQATIIPK